MEPLEPSEIVPPLCILPEVNPLCILPLVSSAAAYLDVPPVSVMECRRNSADKIPAVIGAAALPVLDPVPVPVLHPSPPVRAVECKHLPPPVSAPSADKIRNHAHKKYRPVLIIGRFSGGFIVHDMGYRAKYRGCKCPASAK